MNPLLNQSTQVAQQAAKLIGGTFQQGVGFTPGRGSRNINRGDSFGSSALASRVRSALGGQPTTSLNSEQIGTVQPYAIPPESTPTASAGLGSYLDSLQLDPTSQQAMTTANSLIPQTGLENQKNTLGQALLDRIMGRKGETEMRDEEYSKTVDPAKKELDDIQNQIRSKSLAYRRQIEEMRSGSGGTVEGMRAQVADIERKANSELADLSIIEQAKLANYSTAKEISDRKITMVLEKEATQLEGLKFAYQEVKADFTKEEDRRFNLMISERERLLGAEEDRLKTIQGLAIEAVKAGTPISVVSAMQKAGSVEEALRIGGRYLAPRGDAKRSTQVVDVNGKKFLIDTQTGELISEIGGSGLDGNAMQLAQGENNISQIGGLITHSGLKGLVGNMFTRNRDPINELRGTYTDFIASISQVTDQLTLDKLVQAKQAGATFGALSDQERVTLASAATKLKGYELRNKQGNVIGYNTSEKIFKAELDKINNFAKLDYILKGGTPSSVGVEVMTDGTMWTKNSNGTFTRIR